MVWSKWRIGASRRTRAAAALAELQRHESGSPLNAKEFPELGKSIVIKGQIQSSKFGNLSFLKSVNELNITKITPAEKKKHMSFFVIVTRAIGLNILTRFLLR